MNIVTARITCRAEYPVSVHALVGHSYVSRKFILWSWTSSLGMTRKASQTRRGRTIRSSRCPITGMKSGMRSMGDTAYAKAPPSNQRANRGQRGSRRIERYIPISVRNVRTSSANLFFISPGVKHCLYNFCIKPNIAETAM